MQIILSPNCKALTGSIGRGFGYHIEHRKHGFFGVRDAKGIIPPDGHWRFILTCAEIAHSNLHIADIRVPRRELVYALWGAGYETAGDYVFTEPEKFPEIFSASDVINYKRDYLPYMA